MKKMLPKILAVVLPFFIASVALADSGILRQTRAGGSTSLFENSRRACLPQAEKPHGVICLPCENVASECIDAPMSGMREIISSGVESPITREMIPIIGEEIASNPLSYRAYQQMARQGVRYELNFGEAAVGELGAYYRGQSLVSTNVRNASGITDVIGNMVHESSHVQRASRGFTRSTRYEEYRAFRRRYLYETGQRPDAQARAEIWKAVNELYSDLPVR